MFSKFWNFINGPQLYKIYDFEDQPSHLYEANFTENFARNILKWMKVCWTIFCYTSPFTLPFIIKKVNFTSEGLVYYGTYIAGFSFLYVLAHLIKAFGCITNPEYTSFISILNESQNKFPVETKLKLMKYDFCFSSWPIEYSTGNKSIKEKSLITELSLSYKRNNININKAKSSITGSILSYIVVHLFGIRLLYPGSLSLIQTLMAEHLILGREKLIEQHKGIRTKLQSDQLNEIDTMFIDKRATGTLKSNILVICTEGNAGFYEIGIMTTPIEAGYSVLGWNHPGFWGSTGTPVPLEEESSIDAVMQYAINILNFNPSQIILFAWSIGGYSASWAAMTYPDIRAVILDATFDHILPLALNRMPRSWKSLVELVIGTHLNLDNSALLKKYPGKILLIRRTKDEMITTDDSASLETNRGNFLLIDILNHRYPHIVNNETQQVLQEWLNISKSYKDYSHTNSTDDMGIMEIFNNKSESEKNFPSLIGEELSIEQKTKAAIYLAKNYMDEYDSTHCTPLPLAIFREPTFY